LRTLLSMTAAIGCDDHGGDKEKREMVFH
jgi:hypothetical protein